MAKERLLMELKEIQTKPPPSCTVCTNGEDIFNWLASIKGPDGSPYAGGVFVLNINFPKDYPFTPPKVSFQTKIYHPNFNSKGSSVDILKTWSPTFNISQVLESICLLLKNPNPGDPQVSEIAKVYNTEWNRYKALAGSWTQQYAIN